MEPNKTERSELMKVIPVALRRKVTELGLSLAAFDASGILLKPFCAGNSFCQTVSDSPLERCRHSAHELAMQVLQSGQPGRATGPCGCCLMGLPVVDHRRLAGVLVLGYPTVQMADEEHLARLCDRFQLDRQVMQAYAKQSCRHRAEDAADLQRVITWMLNDQKESQENTQALTSLSKNLASTYEGLNLLYHVSGAMKVSQNPRDFLQDVCDNLQDVMNVAVAAAIVYDEQTQLDDDIVVKSGDDEIDFQMLRLLAATRISPRLLNDRKPYVENHFDGRDNVVFGRHVERIIAVPLVIDKRNVGILLGLNKPTDFDSFDVSLINTIANQASVFLANNRMYAELQDLLMGVLHSLTESIDAKDPYTCGHSRRVAAIARRLAEACGYSPERVRDIYLSGLLHDVGKIGVPEAILCKDGRLTDEEYNSIKRHPVIGAKILRRIRHLDPIIAGVLTHHERPDGRGYPGGLGGEDVPIEGLMVGLADSWDAMTSHRTYRRARPVGEAITEIRRCVGSQFDPHLVEIFLSWDLEEYMKELHALNAHDLHLFDETLP
jgi:putative nucleotidyltransferase with HDIG domain